MRFLTQRHAQIAAPIVFGLAAWIIVTARPFTTEATVAVFVVGISVSIIVLRQPTKQHPVRDRSFPQVAILAWSLLAAILIGWDVQAWVQQSQWNINSYAHPTLSSLVSPLIRHDPGRLIAVLLWLGGGWGFLRRASR